MTDEIPTIYGKPTAEELKNCVSLIEDDTAEDEEICKEEVKKNGSKSNAPKRKH